MSKKMPTCSSFWQKLNAMLQTTTASMMNMCKGNLIGQRCRSPYIEEFELWQAALGTCDADYFQVKMEQLSCEGIDPFSTCSEAQVSHPHCCREWPLRLLCRAATEDRMLLRNWRLCCCRNRRLFVPSPRASGAATQKRAIADGFA